jgi:copper chaperone CopZ
MKTISLSIDGMHCGHCVAAVKHALESVPGVGVRDIRIGEATLETEGDPSVDAIRAAVEDAGYVAEVRAG